MVVTACHDAHKPGFGFQGHGPAIGREREAGADEFQTRGFSFGRGLANHDDFRIGKAHRRNGRGAELPVFAGNDLGNHLALGHSAMGKHRFTGQVANRPDVAHAGVAAVVHANRRAVHAQRQGFKVVAPGARATADRNQHLIGFQGLALAHGITHRKRFGAGLEAFHAVGQVQGDT